MRRQVQLQRDEVLCVLKVRVVRVGLYELRNSVRVDVIGICFFLIARHVFFLVVVFVLGSEDACPLAMRELASLVLTTASIAKVGAFENVALRTFRAVGAVSVEPERLTNRGTWRCFRVSILAVSLGAVAFGIVKTVGDTLGSQFMRQIAGGAICALSIFEEVFACSNFLSVVNIAAACAFLT